MANRYFRPHRMSSIKKVIRQWASVRKTYNNIESHSVTSDRFSCIMNITPSENSDTYKVEISYKADHFPRAKLLSHKLEERDGEFPHHIYGFDKNGCARLCVFYPGNKEWNSNMLISESFIPWVSTWLNAYEFWLITGEWHYAEITDRKKPIKGRIKNDSTNQTKN